MNEFDPKPVFLNLDEMADGKERQDTLKEISNHATVPNIFVAGVHVGGYTDMMSKIKTGEFQTLLNKVNVKHKL